MLYLIDKRHQYYKVIPAPMGAVTMIVPVANVQVGGLMWLLALPELPVRH